jgi:two-component system sensor histidine kinase ResE
METMQKELEHLTHLIDDLFELSRLDVRRLALVREPTSLRDLLSDTLGSLTAQAKQHDIKLMDVIAPGVDVVNIAADKIQRVLYNLLDNALHHTPPGGTITLSVQRTGNQVKIGVHNTGSTVSTGDLPHLFESFYRGETARTQQSNGYRGTGLGLAIARGFVEAHGGQIQVESQADNGTTFTFTLPL